LSRQCPLGCGPIPKHDAHCKCGFKPERRLSKQPRERRMTDRNETPSKRGYEWPFKSTKYPKGVEE
jgi:hypothetical protein